MSRLGVKTPVFWGFFFWGGSEKDTNKFRVARGTTDTTTNRKKQT
jgi:hypothetical protein